MSHAGSTLQWRKSSYSTGAGGECVELAATPGSLLIRDSKDPDGSTLDLTYSYARALIKGLQGRMTA